MRDTNAAKVISIETKSASTRRRNKSVRAQSGATATVEGSAIVVRDPRGSIVVQYDAETGTATIAAPNGDLELAAAGAVRVKAGTDIAFDSKTLTVQTGKWELAAERILERASEAYRQVDGLVQTRAGRLRTLIKGAAQIFTGTTSMVSKGDTEIDGKQVLLG